MALMSSKEQPAHLYPFFFTNALRFKTYKLVKTSVTKLDIQNVSDTTLDVPMEHSEASHDKPKSSLERISKWWKHIMEKFGWV